MRPGFGSCLAVLSAIILLTDQYLNAQAPCNQTGDSTSTLIYPSVPSYNTVENLKYYFSRTAGPERLRAACFHAPGSRRVIAALEKARAAVAFLLELRSPQTSFAI